MTVSVYTDIYLSPLRYPGGKASLSDFFENVLTLNKINGTYCEAYAGGAGAALNLLFANKVKKIILNDADFHIYAFWYSVLNHTDEFISAIKKCRISIPQWKKQRKIYEKPLEHSLFQVGFSTFFLNRCNRGGILPNAGPIGGFEQEGNYSIDARFNKENLINRIKNIGDKGENIEIHNLDATDFLSNVISTLNPAQTLIYLDPPYFQQGQKLYLNFYDESDHEVIEKSLQGFSNYKWIVSYDNVPEINDIYEEYRKFSFNLNYSVQVCRKGKELMVFSSRLKLPSHFVVRKSTEKLIYS